MTDKDLEKLLIKIGFKRNIIDNKISECQWILNHNNIPYYYNAYSGSYSSSYSSLQKNINKYAETLFIIPFIYDLENYETKLNYDEVYNSLKKEFHHILRKKKIEGLL